MSVDSNAAPPTVSRRQLVQHLLGKGAGALATAMGTGVSVAELTAPPAAEAATPAPVPTTQRKFRYGMVPENPLIINPATAARYGVADGQVVWLESSYGKVKARVKATTRIHPEVVGLQHGFGHTALGRLAKGRGTTDSPLRPTKSDPLSGQAMDKEACVRIVSV